MPRRNCSSRNDNHDHAESPYDIHPRHSTPQHAFKQGHLPAPSPPDPDLHPEVIEQLLQKSSPAINESRFSMVDFFRNKAAMTAAARKELAGGLDHTLHGPSLDQDDVASSLEGVLSDSSRQPCSGFKGSSSSRSKLAWCQWPCRLTCQTDAGPAYGCENMYQPTHPSVPPAHLRLPKS